MARSDSNLRCVIARSFHELKSAENPELEVLLTQHVDTSMITRSQIGLPWRRKYAFKLEAGNLFYLKLRPTPPMRALPSSLMLLFVAGISATEPSHAQGLLDRAKQTATDAANNAAGTATDDASGAATNAAASAVTGKGAAKAPSAATAAPATPAAGPATSSVAATPVGSSASDPEPKVFVNYDFIPGDRVIFAEDFTADAVGDFPRRFELQSGNVEVAERSGQRFIRTTGDATITIPLSETLPDRFTFEMDYVVASTWKMGVAFTDPSGDPTEVSASMENAGLDGGGCSPRPTFRRTPCSRWRTWP